ncbi:MAG: hypothetical protein MUC84_02120 [Solirubrobacteraceae bacterium]|jgi:hypothetical protein|nr:hypothetical protein [Solirubrobacteraceae bacterium]
MSVAPDTFARLHSGHLVWVEAVDGDTARVVLLERHPPEVVSVAATDLVGGTAPRPMPAPGVTPVVAVEPDVAG